MAAMMMLAGHRASFNMTLCGSPTLFRWSWESKNSTRQSTFLSITCRAVQLVEPCAQTCVPHLFASPVTSGLPSGDSGKTSLGASDSSLETSGAKRSKKRQISGDSAQQKVGAKSRRMQKRRRAEAKLRIARDLKKNDPTGHAKKSPEVAKALDSAAQSADELARLAQGVQDLLAIRAVKTRLERRLGRTATFAEWARAMRMEPSAFYLRHSYADSCWNTMIKCNLKFVCTVANTFKGTDLTTQDLVQAGTLGLIRSCAGFDASKGFKFSTFAYFWIARMIGKAIAKHSHSLRLPERLFYKLKKVVKAKRKMMSKKENPSLEEFAAHLGFTANRSQLLLNLSKGCKCLPGGSGGKNMDHLSDTSMDSPETVAYGQVVKNDIENALMVLEPRERAILKLRYGLEDGQSRTLQEVGNICGLTRERIRVLENGIIQTLNTSTALQGSLEESLLYK